MVLDERLGVWGGGGGYGQEAHEVLIFVLVHGLKRVVDDVVNLNVLKSDGPWENADFLSYFSNGAGALDLVKKRKVVVVKNFYEASTVPGLRETYDQIPVVPVDTSDIIVPNFSGVYGTNDFRVEVYVIPVDSVQAIAVYLYSNQPFLEII